MSKKKSIHHAVSIVSVTLQQFRVGLFFQVTFTFSLTGSDLDSLSMSEALNFVLVELNKQNQRGKTM